MKGRSDTDTKFRSLLQKAVRRGNVDLVFTTSALLATLGRLEKMRFRTQAAAITFEECWPLGAKLVFNKKFHSKVAALVRVAQSVKARDATGLGYLAFALAEGDATVLRGDAEDRAVKIVARAVQRPDDFWQWTASEKKATDQKAFFQTAHRFRNAGTSRDRAVVRAAAYLAVTAGIPPARLAPPSEQKFPFFITFDRHTPEGRRVLRDVARDLHIRLPQLEWTCFYFEGSAPNAAAPSQWWDRLCQWYFKKIDLPPSEAHLLWQPAKGQVMDGLAEDSRRLKNELYKWKLANLERIEYLKRQVEIFNEHIDQVQPDQRQLF